ncbi:unnamed protein product [Prunus brigantina]
MKELRETRKVAEKALEKAQNTACREGSKEALIWFRQLKSRPISSFTQLCEMFISQYTFIQKRRKGVMVLINTKQRIKESLKDYLRHFTEEMSTLEECDSHTASLAFREGVIPGIS